MRRAFSTFCCVVVGLQLLAALIVTSGAALLYLAESRGPFALEVRSTSTSAAGISAPWATCDQPCCELPPAVADAECAPAWPDALEALPLAFEDGPADAHHQPPAKVAHVEGLPLPLMTPAPTLSAPKPASIAEVADHAMPPLGEADAGNAAESAGLAVPRDLTLQERLRIENILASRRQQGSVLEGSVLAAAGNDPADEEQALVETFRRIAMEEVRQEPEPAAASKLASLQPVVSVVDESEAEESASGEDKPSAESAQSAHEHLMDSLGGLVQHLYALAERHEHESGNWERADELRELARRLRSEAIIIANEDTPWDSRPALPTYRAPAAAVELAPGVWPRIIMREEDEAELGIELDLPQADLPDQL